MGDLGKTERILVACDFSADAEQALATALALGGRFGAEIHLVYVYPRPLDLFSTFGIDVRAPSAPEVRRSAAVRLDQELAKVRDAGLRGEWHFREGHPSDELADAARELSADLIVMGTRGLTGLAHVMLGSVAERTVRKASCPVLTVKAPHSGAR